MNTDTPLLLIIASCLVAVGCAGAPWTAHDRREGITKGVFRVYVRASREALANLDPDGRRHVLRQCADERLVMLMDQLLATQQRDDTHRSRVRSLLPIVISSAKIAREDCRSGFCELFVDYPVKDHDALIRE